MVCSALSMLFVTSPLKLHSFLMTSLAPFVTATCRSSLSYPNPVSRPNWSTCATNREAASFVKRDVRWYGSNVATKRSRLSYKLLYAGIPREVGGSVFDKRCFVTFQLFEVVFPRA